MTDNRDFRVRAYLFFDNQGVANGLFNHVKGLEADAVDINPGLPNAEPKFVIEGDTYTVEFDLCFPPDKQDKAEGLYNHSVNTPSKVSPVGEVCFVSLERCGHNGTPPTPCVVTERWEVGLGRVI